MVTTVSRTKDWSNKAFDLVVATAAKVETKPEWILSFCFAESACIASEVCRAKSGDPVAVGLNQILCQPAGASNLEAVGWHGGVAAYLALCPEAQWPYVDTYLSWYTGKLTSQAGAYLANFLPADLGHEDDPSFVLVDSGSRKSGDSTPIATPPQRQGFYAPNADLDAMKKGYITVGDLSAAIQRACVGSRWQELSGRLSDAVLRATSPAQDPAPATAPTPPQADAGDVVLEEPDDASKVWESP